MTSDVAWLFFLITFYLVCFSYQFGRLFGSFVDFLFREGVLRKREVISVNNMIISFYAHYICNLDFLNFNVKCMQKEFLMSYRHLGYWTHSLGLKGPIK